jgi:hypothetical protein
VKNGAIKEICPLCGFEYYMGPHLYEGHMLKSYGIMICKGCWEVNWDGFSRRHEPKLIEALKNNGLPTPNRLENGLLPRT